MFGRAPGPGGPVNRPLALAPSTPARAEPGTADWIPMGAEPVRNSTIQSAVSVRTSSVTSSANLRSTPRHRSAASTSVPSAGPRTSRPLSEAH